MFSRPQFSSASSSPIVSSSTCMVEKSVHDAVRRLFWAAVWLGVVLIVTKSYYLGAPRSFFIGELVAHLRSLMAISYADVLFVAALWASARIATIIVKRRPPVVRHVSIAFVTVAVCFCVYAFAIVLIFGVFVAFL